MTINFDTLFSRIGKALKMAEGIVTLGATTVPTQLTAFLTLLQTDSPEDQLYVQSGTDTELAALESNLSSAIAGLVATPISLLIRRTVLNDMPALPNTIQDALAELIRQMIAEGESLDKTTVSLATSYGAGNFGDGILLWTTQRADGLINELMYAETIAATMRDIGNVMLGNAGEATWLLSSGAAVGMLDPTWPAESRTSVVIKSCISASPENLVPNGGFEDESATVSKLPDGWQCPVGVPGTTVKLTDIEEQTVTINGTPTGGYYLLNWTDPDGNTHSTAPLPYNATAAQVQDALRAIAGLECADVTATGTSPNITLTVTINGIPNPATLSYTSYLTGGSPTITTTTPTPGSAYTMRGARCLQLVGANPGENTTLMVPVSVQPSTQYGVCFWAATNSAPAAGVLTVDLVDGLGGSTIEDEQGTANTYTVDCTALTGTHSSHTGVFRTPAMIPATVYLRIRATTPITNTKNVFLDELCMVPMREIYAGGPFVCAFTGKIRFEYMDTASTVVTSDRAGTLHEWLNRCLGLNSKRLLFPTAAIGTQPDGLIS